MVSTLIEEDIKRQAEMESRLLRIWEEGFSDSETIKEVFGPYESWILPLGGHLLFLDPLLQEWCYLDKLHDTWERTGFSPGEVVFVVRDKKQRMGRNPQTGEPMAISARRVVSFKPSQLLNKEVNK